MDPRQLSIHDFTYELPDGRIAQYALAERDASKLLVYRHGEIAESSFYRLAELLDDGDLLIFNETKVVHARLVFQKETGARIEVFCLEPFSIKETALAFSQKHSAEWICMIGNSKRWKDEVLSKKVDTGQRTFTLSAEKISQEHESFAIRFSWDADLSFAEVIQHAGLLPLPPYLNRESLHEDEHRYQTVYARYDGSVAAPTAGLHFTEEVFMQLEEKKVESSFLTLHVGAGTFKPVNADVMQDHEMHEERMEISLALLEKICEKAGHNRIIAVGTTALRTLESIYWFGVKLLADPDMDHFFIDQWEAYLPDNKTTGVKEAYQAVTDWMHRKQITRLTGSTRILIAPPYEVKVADALITNFHQPESTLLLLVAAFIGNDWRAVYQYALDHDFRFLSYGDSSILFRK